HQSTLFAVPFDAGRLALTGAAVPMLEDVSSTQIAGGDFAFAGNGTFVYLTEGPGVAGYPISWVDSGGKTAQPLHAPPGRYITPRFSPDGKRLAFSMSTGKGSDLWVKDLDRDTTSRLSFLPGVNAHPVWTPDGMTIVFHSSNPGASGLHAIRSDGSGEAKRLTEGTQFPISFLPDGKRLAVTRNMVGNLYDIFTMPVEADSGPGAAGIRLGKAELFLGTRFDERSPAFSPDGRWLAYHSNESGTSEVYVRPFPGPGGKWQVSTGGGRYAKWSRDGRDLLYQALDGRVMATGYVAKGDTFAAGNPRVWAEVRLRDLAGNQSYDIAPDGKRLAAIVADDGEAEKLPTSLTFLMNFTDELRRKAPEGK
ncbi:MAG: hypothetical protein ACKV2U_06055, partial [Bryobacteraceae bacterium]